MVQHIYGNTNILSDNQRPNMFINELKMYVDYLKRKLQIQLLRSRIPRLKMEQFQKKCSGRIDYYHNLFTTSSFFRNGLQTISLQLQHYKLELTAIEIPQAEK
jgi:hypothetical protein